MNAVARILFLQSALAVVLFSRVLAFRFDTFENAEAALIQNDWLWIACLSIWYLTFLLANRCLNRLLIVGILLTSLSVCLFGYDVTWQTENAPVFLFGATLGGCAQFFSTDGTQATERRFFLIGLAMLLTLASIWYPDKSISYYRGPRWIGPWSDPNTYGALLGAGFATTVSLLGAEMKGKGEKRGLFEKMQSTVLLASAFTMSAGLLFSYSRGAWVGAAAGMVFSMRSHWRFGQRYVTPLLLLAPVLLLFVACFFWKTPRTEPWYFQRLDLSRGSVQHRLTAWKAGFKIMWDHPFGVGWNKTVEIYERSYSPPPGGAAAMVTNDYLMLGTQLGIPALICFVAYVGLCFRNPKAEAKNPESTVHDAKSDKGAGTVPLDSTQIACRAGALSMLVAFWFDGGLFKLATSSVFWILLELGAACSPVLQPSPQPAIASPDKT